MSEKQSLGTLVSGVTEDLSALVRGEIELAKAELRDTARTAGKGTGLLVGAGVLAFLGFVFLLLTAAWGLVQAGLPYWAAFGIVTLVLIIVAVILALVGKSQLEKIKGPERTQVQLEKTKAVLSRQPVDATPPVDLP
ncbi:MAG: phage holin family protein [Candidatus Nanopelagicales bacterium]